MPTIVTTLLIALALLSIATQACSSRSETLSAPVAKETAPPLSTKPGWEEEWERTLSAARKEGQVNFYSGYNATWRQAISEAMKQKYSINMEFVVGSTEDITARLMSEQRSKVYYADATSISTSTMDKYTEGILQPLDKTFILPEVKDPKFWWEGKFTWLDPDQRTMLAWRQTVVPSIVINTDFVKPEEVKSWNDLLNPKWKGKLLIQDPTTGGGGQRVMTMFIYKIMSREFIYELLKQEPQVQRDNRLLVEWVARGRYPILLGPRTEEAFQFIRAGAPLTFVTPAEGAYMSVGDGCIGFLRLSSQPNAAKIFINFFLSKEGQTMAAKTMGQHTLRTDVPTDFQEPATVRQPGMKYISTLEKGYMEREVELRTEVTRIFQDYLRK